MTSIIKFTALSGAQDEAPPCYLLQVDEFCFLLDCGWNPHFTMATVRRRSRGVEPTLSLPLSLCTLSLCLSVSLSLSFMSYTRGHTHTLPTHRHLHQIDAILLTFPNMGHLGLLPYLMGRLGLKCPVYATVPVYKLGQIFLCDLHQVCV